RSEEPAPEEEGAFLSRPQRRHLVSGRQGAIAVMEDVGQGKIVSERSPDQRQGRASNRDKAGHAGTTSGFGKPIADSVFANSRYYAHDQGVTGQGQSEQEAKASE